MLLGKHPGRRFDVHRSASSEGSRTTASIVAPSTDGVLRFDWVSRMPGRVPKAVGDPPFTRFQHIIRGFNLYSEMRQRSAVLVDHDLEGPP